MSTDHETGKEVVGAADTGADTKPAHKDRTHWLYIAVLIAIVAGVIVGLVAPDVGKALGVLGTLFVNLIKMMISPVIFCTIVLGIGSVRKAASVGKVGGLALGLLPGDVHHRPGHRPGGRQPHRPRDGPEHPRRPGGGRQTGGTGTRRGRRARILREHHPHVAAVVVDLGQRPADTLRRAARRVRAAGHGRHR